MPCLLGQLQQTSFARNDGLVGEVHSQNRADRVQDVAAQGTTGVAGTLLVLVVPRPRARNSVRTSVHLGWPELYTCRPIRGNPFRVPDPSRVSKHLEVKPMALILRVHLCLASYKPFSVVRHVIYLALNRLCQSVGPRRQLHRPRHPRIARYTSYSS